MRYYIIIPCKVLKPSKNLSEMRKFFLKATGHTLSAWRKRHA